MSRGNFVCSVLVPNIYGARQVHQFLRYSVVFGGGGRNGQDDHAFIRFEDCGNGMCFAVIHFEYSQLDAGCVRSYILEE